MRWVKGRFVVVWVILTLLISSIPSLSSASSTSDQHRVAPAEAIKAASEFLRTYAPAHRPEWVGATLMDPVFYQTPDGKPDSYVVTVKDKSGSEALGFVVLGATREHSPIIENSTGPVPHSRLQSAQQIAASHGYAAGKVRLVHGGPTAFLAEFKDASHPEPLYVNLSNLKTIGKKYVQNPGTPSVEGRRTANEQWRRLTQGQAAGDVSVQVVTSRQISNFPTGFDQDLTDHPASGCGPTAGSAIYWWYAEYKGYPNLRYQGSYDWLDLANHLYDDMDTGIFGTSETEWAQGMQIHAQSHSGYNFTSQAVNSSSNVTDKYSSFKTEINYDRPTGVYIGINFGYDDPFEYHIMPTYGYYHDTNVGYRQIDVATNWGYASSFDYDYYRSRYNIYFMWVTPPA